MTIGDLYVLKPLYLLKPLYVLKKSGWIFLAWLVIACGDAQQPAERPADAIATWNGGSLVLADVESAFATARLPACRKARRRGGLEELVACYRELASSLALEKQVLSEVEDLDQALVTLGEDGEGYRRLRRRAYLEAFIHRLQEEVDVDDTEIEARFRADPERFRRPGQLSLSNIFRRHEDPSRPEDTEAFLHTLKERFDAGETFAALAREHSQSETRLRGGEVGRVSEDDLPARLRRVAFALGDGEVSEPVRVKGGAVLLYVQGITDGAEPSLAQAQSQIRQELTTERVEQAISERAAERQPPAGSLILDLDQLVQALDSGDPETMVLEIENERLEAGQLRDLAGMSLRSSAAELDDSGRDRLFKIYSRQRERSLLALRLLDAADPDLTAQAEPNLRQAAISRLVDERVRDEMNRQVDIGSETLRSYFNDNRHHYQSSLRFLLRKWNLPFGDDPPAQMRRMEALRSRLVAGALELEGAIAELGGSVEDLGWQEFTRLEEEIPNKARAYLMEIGEQGWSVPYQQDDALHLIELVERDNPRPLEYEEAAERVREDYLQRFQQELYGQVAEERLSAAGYTFDEDTLRRVLAPESPAPESSPGA